MVECLTPWYLLNNLFADNACSEIYSSGLPSDPMTMLEYLPYFLKTFILELPLYALILKSQQSFVKNLTANTLLNLATHPVIFILFPMVLPRLGDFNYLNYLVAAEIFAPIVEALLLIKVFKIKLGWAFVSAIAANLFSWSVGVYWI
jgi:hypothetical protein